MSMDNPTLGGATMAPGLLPIVAPAAPAVSPYPGLYALMAPFMANVIGLAATAPIKIIQRVETRPNPNKPPVSTFPSETQIVAYVSGPRPVRSEDGSMIGVSRIKIFATAETVMVTPEVDMQVEFDGDLYVIALVKRLPLSGPAVAWRIEAERGR